MVHTLYDIEPLIPLIESGFALLTPNLRMARRIKSEWDARCAAGGVTVWEPLPVMPLENWLQQQWQRAVSLGHLPPLLQLTGSQTLELWRQVIARDESDSDQYHLLRPSAAAELASQARDVLLRWQVDPQARDIRQEFGLDLDCATFLRWLDQFERRLTGSGQATFVDCVAQLAECQGSAPGTPVALLEFDDIPPLYLGAVRSLASELRELDAAGEGGKRLVYDFPDKRSELHTVARWAATAARQQPGASLGIVLSEMASERGTMEYLLRREFECLGDNYTSLPVNFSTGIALDRAPVIRDALALLALSGPRAAVSAVVELMRSRFVRLPDRSSPLAHYFINRLFEAGREQLDTAELRNSASEIRLGEQQGLLLGQCLRTVSGMRELRKKAVPSVWIERFCAILEVWGWPGEGTLDSLEFQQVQLWHQTLDEFRRYDAVCRPMVFAEALQLLKASCNSQVSQPATPDSNIQVLGPLEAAGLEFDQLWLCGMQAGRWPAPARPNPFIPVSLQRRRAMPHSTPQREWEFAAALLKQYTRGAAVLHASYCRQLDDAPELPSALLEDFVPASLPAVAAIDPEWTRQWQNRKLECLDDQQAPALELPAAGGVGGGSGLLEDQSQCPFRAFARRRLQVEPLPAFSLALSAADRGNLLHHALNTLWGVIGDHGTLLSLDDNAEQELLDTAVQSAVASFPASRRRALGLRYWELEAQRLQGLLHEWLALERARGDFAVAHRETDMVLNLGPLQLGLRVDRIDRMPDGSRVIIDYKSGICKVGDWLGDRPPKPQLLLYAVGAPQEIAALAFAQVRPRDSKFVGLGRVAAAPGIATDIGKAVGESMTAADWDSLNSQWRENLERLAAEFVAGQAAVDPLSSTSCTWCGLQPLCRVAHGDAETAEDQGA